MINIVVFRASWRIDTNAFWLLISQFENLTRGQVKLLISWMTKVDHAAYQLLCHDKTNIMTPRARSNSIPPELLTYVFLTYEVVVWPVRGSLASSCIWYIAELHLNRHRLFIYHRCWKQEERFGTGNICINWVVTGPWEQCHSSTTKIHRNLPRTELIEGSWKVS